MRHTWQRSVLGGMLWVMWLAVPAAQAREEWFRGLDLEGAIAQSDLIMVARVAEVSETTFTFGGKAEREIQQFRFAPVRIMKGVFARDHLSLTTNELGSFGEGPTRIERGQVRLMLLGRAGPGYCNRNERSTLDLSLPPFQDENDPLRAAVETLIKVTQQPDRAKKVTLVLEGLRTAKDHSVVPLLFALQRRDLLAAQTPDIVTAIVPHLRSDSPAVRETAARTLHALLQADYLDNRTLRDAAVARLTAALEQTDATISVRVLLLEALGAAGAATLENKTAVPQLKLEQALKTFAERTALLRVIATLKMADQREAVQKFWSELPLDAPHDLQLAAGLALAQLDAEQAAKTLQTRLFQIDQAGLSITEHLHLLAKLPPAAAVPVILEIGKRGLHRVERLALAAVCVEVKDPRLIPLLSGMLDPRYPDIHYYAVEALRKIDTVEAARILRPYLRMEADLTRKLQIAEMLGRHDIRDGYVYAIEHMSEAHLLEQAVAALAAIREPKTSGVARDILKNSNDPTWNSVAIRVLGALGEKELADEFLQSAQNLKNPLAPAALLALGDLGDVRALPRVREGLTSRNHNVAMSAARAAKKLLVLPEVKANELREQLAVLLTDSDAPQDLRLAALEALHDGKDSRLDQALIQVARDATLEGSELLLRAEKLLRERKAKLL